MKKYNLNNEDVERAVLKNWPLPDEYLIEIGRISSLWVSLESTLEISVGRLAGFDESNNRRGFIVLRHSSVPQKLDAFDALCEELKGEYPALQNYKAVSGKIRAVQLQRNKILHNIIGFEVDGFYLLEGSARKKIRTQLTKITPSDLKKISMEIHLANLALHELVTGKGYPPVWFKT